MKIDGHTPLFSVLTLSAALIVCTLILAGSLVRVKSRQGTIRVTGSVREQVRSDYALWHGEITQQAPTLPQAYKGLRESERKVTAYLTAQGLTFPEIRPGAIQTEPVFAKPPPVVVRTAAGPVAVPAGEDDADPSLRRVASYRLTEGIDVQSDKVDLVERVSRSATGLISAGVAFTSQPPQYVFQDMAGLKMRILAEAGRNAHERAEEIATSGGGRVGALQYAHMGVMQVTPAYEDAPVSGQGTEDTSSLDKKVTAIVSVGYAIR
ncbi:MAG: SIMPL domain-containing protein [Armatimonadetes bacterium]|nr:SIMPL domain-containing protein [Armatimonadota bacterium]